MLVYGSFFMSNYTRIYGLDVLRGVAMTLGIFLHSTIAYKKGYHYGEWAFDPEFKSYFFDWIYIWINSFRMQVFFLLAGFFAHLLIKKIGIFPFTKNRMKRVALPLLLSYFTILPLTLLPYLYVLYARDGDPWQPLSDFFVNFFTLRAHSGFMHLWFLQHLVIYYSITIGFVILYQKFLSERIFSVFPSGKISSRGFLILTVFLIGGISQLFSTPLPNIWTGFIIPIPQFLYYGAFFILGWLLEMNRDLFFSFKVSYKSWLIAGTLISFVALYLSNIYVALPSFSMEHVGLKSLFAIQTVLLTLGFIGFFTEEFKNPSGFWKYIADSSYWVYLIHMPIVFGAQIFLINSDVPGILRFPIVVLVSILISFLSYHYLVRYTWIGYMLNGKRFKRGQ